MPDTSAGAPVGLQLTAGQRRHVLSAYVSVQHFLRQMEEVAAEGRSPTGVGAALTPMAREDAAVILEPVRGLARRLRAVAAELAPAELAAFETPQSLNNTLVWMSNLLDRMRASVDGLAPSRVRKYGQVGEAEEEFFAALHEELLARIAAARDGRGAV